MLYNVSPAVVADFGKGRGYSMRYDLKAGCWTARSRFRISRLTSILQWQAGFYVPFDEVLPVFIAPEVLRSRPKRRAKAWVDL